MENCSLTISDDKDWNYLINNSDQGSIFIDKIFLDSLNKNYQRYIFKKKKIIKGGIVVLLNDKKKIILHKLQIYSGILFCHEKNASITSKISAEIETSEFICKNLLERYSHLKFCNHYNFDDLRPFQWLKFDRKIKNLKIDIKYTGLLNIEDFLSEKSYENSHNYSMLNKNKKEIIRSVKNKKIIFKSIFSRDNSYLLESYQSMIKNNNLLWTKNDINVLKKLTNNLLSKNRAIINYILDSNNNIIYSTCYAWFKDVGYYLYGGRKSSIKDGWSSTISHWEMFGYLSKKKIKTIDLEGINSPERGHFKTSFGAQIKSYYLIKFDKY